MLRSMQTAASGMHAQQTRIDNIANNLANVNTTGFKRSQLDFQDLLYVTLRSAGAEAAQGTQIPTGLQVGSGDRSERIRTYNFPQSRITDHRIGLTVHNLDAIMAGDLEEVVNAILAYRREEALAATRQ